jgi:DNA-directed RNA polymerase subunit RPC12/RpoP
MPQIRLQVVEPPPEGSTATVLMQQDVSHPVFTGHGPVETGVDYLCGKCGAVLALNVREKQFRNIVFSCKGCSSFNRVP